MLSTLSVSAAVRAGPFEDGQAAYDAMDYATAATALGEAAADPGLTSTQRARAHLLLGMVRLTLGEQDLAQQHFVAAVTLDPALEVPPDASPKIRAIVDEARRATAEQPEPPAATGTPLATAADPAPAPPAATAATPAAPTAPVVVEETSLWSSPWLWGAVAVVGVAAAVAGAIAVVMALSGAPPDPDPPADSCDAPSGAGCVQVTF